MIVIIKNKIQYEKAKQELEEYEKALKKAVTAQSFTIGSQQISRPQIDKLEKIISDYRAAIDAYETSGTTKRKMKRVVPFG